MLWKVRCLKIVRIVQSYIRKVEQKSFRSGCRAVWRDTFGNSLLSTAPHLLLQSKTTVKKVVMYQNIVKGIEKRSLLQTTFFGLSNFFWSLALWASPKQSSNTRHGLGRYKINAALNNFVLVKTSEVCVLHFLGRRC